MKSFLASRFWQCRECTLHERTTIEPKMGSEAKKAVMLEGNAKEVSLLQSLEDIQDQLARLDRRVQGEDPDDNTLDWEGCRRTNSMIQSTSEAVELGARKKNDDSASLDHGDGVLCKKLVESAQSRLRGPGQWRSRVTVIAKGVAAVSLAIEADWQLKEPKPNGELEITTALRGLAEIAAQFAQDTDALWISGASDGCGISRLLHV